MKIIHPNCDHNKDYYPMYKITVTRILNGHDSMWLFTDENNISNLSVTDQGIYYLKNKCDRPTKLLDPKTLPDQWKYYFKQTWLINKNAISNRCGRPIKFLFKTDVNNQWICYCKQAWQINENIISNRRDRPMKMLLQIWVKQTNENTISNLSLTNQ